MKIEQPRVDNYIVLLILIKPILFDYISTVNYIYYAFKLIAAAVICLDYINYFRQSEKKDSSYTFLIIIYFAILAFSTIINSGDIIGLAGTAINTTALIMFTELGIRRDKELLLKSYIDILDVYVFINLITLLLFPDGITQSSGGGKVYFIGGDNRFIFTYLPLICFRFCYSYYKYDRLRTSDYFMYILCLGSLVVTWTVGAMLGMLLFIPFLLVIVNNRRMDKICNIFTYAGVALAANYLLIIQNIQIYFTFFIEGVLKKDTSLSSRTYIWENTLYWIYENPILGNGYEELNVITGKLHGANHPHNYILTILYRGGILCFACFIGLIVCAGSNMSKHKDSKMTKVIAFSFFSSLIMSLVDSFDFALFFVIIQFGYYVGYYTDDDGSRVSDFMDDKERCFADGVTIDYMKENDAGNEFMMNLEDVNEINIRFDDEKDVDHTNEIEVNLEDEIDADYGDEAEICFKDTDNLDLIGIGDCMDVTGSLPNQEEE